MKSFRSLVLLSFVMSCALAAFANSAPDPIIKVKDPTCVSHCNDLFGTHFQFFTPPSGTGFLTFTNHSGVDWTSLKLVESGVPAGAITCLSDLFSCSVFSSNGSTIILLKAGGEFSGITNGMTFQIGFQCKNGCWPGNEKFTATANVPEPGAIALVMTGIGGIISRRKWLARPIA